MEYRIESAGHLSNEETLRAVDAFLNPGSGSSPGFYPHSGPIHQPLPDRHSGFRTGFPDRWGGRESTIGPSGLPKPGLPFGPRPASSFGRASLPSQPRQPRPPTVRFVPISDWGGTERYYFWTDRHQLLTTGSRGGHPRWHHMVGNWQRPIAPYAGSFQPPAGPAQATRTSRSGGRLGKPVSQLSDTEKLVSAMQRSLPKIPDHLKKAVEELLTPANIALFVGLTVVLMSSGVGEVLGLGLLVVGAVAGGIDLCINVLRMVFAFYRKATGAQSERDLDEAADLFAEIILRGGVDMLDILVGRRAAAKLAGRGLSSVGAYFSYLEQEMKLWRGRQGGGSEIRQGTVEEIPKQGSKSPKVTTPRPIKTLSKPQDILDEALKRQGKKPGDPYPENYKEKWSEDGFDYEVRAHQPPNNSPTGSNSSSGPTYRVARKARMPEPIDPKAQGSGWEYMDDKGFWHKESNIKAGKPPEAANSTHIPLPNGTIK